MGKLHNTARWKRLRLQILDRDMWTCQMCGVLLRQGKQRPDSAAVDHTRPHELYKTGHYDPSNLRAVCRSCHDTVCRSIEARLEPDIDAIAAAKLSYRPVGLDGYPIGGGRVNP